MRIQQSLRGVFGARSEAVFVTGAGRAHLVGGTVVYANEALCRLTGFAHREIEGKPALSLIKSDLPAGVWKAEFRPPETPTTPLIIRLQHKSGPEIEASMVSWPIRDSATGVTYLGFQQQSESGQSVLHPQDGEQSNACIFATNLDGKVTSWNRGAVNATGYTAGEMLGKNVQLLCSSPGSKCLPDDIIPILLKEGFFDFRLPVRKKDGGKTHLAFSLSLLRDASGAPCGFLSVSVDITDLARREKALEESSLLLDAIQRLQRQSMSGGDVQLILEDALSTLMEITHSEHGMCGEVRKNSDGESYLKADTVRTRSTDPATLSRFQAYLSKSMDFRNKSSLIGQVLRSGQAVVTDTPLPDQGPRVSPEGRPHLTSFAVLPLLTEEGIAGMIGLANRPAPYSSALMLRIQPLLDCCAGLIKFCRARDHTFSVAARSQRSFNNTRDALIVTDANGDIEEWNPAAEKLLGYPGFEALGKSFVAMCVAWGPAEFRRVIAEIKENGSWDGVITLRGRAGSEVTAEAGGHSVAGDEAPRFMFVIRDVTWCKQAAEALKEASLRFEAFAQNSRCGFWIVTADEERRPLYASPALQTITGLESFVDRKRWDQMIHPDDYASFCAARARLHETGLPIRQKYRIILADGRIRWIESNAFPVRDARGEIHRFAGLLEDVTDYEEAVAKMHRALSEKEALLKEIHHRVKNNLQIISSLLRLQATSTRDPESTAFLQEGRNRVEAIALLHESLYQSENLSVVDFSAYLKRLVTRLMSMNASGETIDVEFDVEPLTLDSERTVLCGLILNELVSNSLRHAFRGRGKGRISVELKAANPTMMSMSVSDNGVGIPPGFDPDQAHSLGLRLVRRLARQLGGTATISNQTGVKVNVSFPRLNSPDLSMPESA